MLWPQNGAEWLKHPCRAAFNVEVHERFAPWHLFVETRIQSNQCQIFVRPIESKSMQAKVRR